LQNTDKYHRVWFTGSLVISSLVLYGEDTNSNVKTPTNTTLFTTRHCEARSNPRLTEPLCVSGIATQFSATQENGSQWRAERK